jgi:chitin synthase
VRAINNFDNQSVIDSIFRSPEFRDLVLGLFITYFAYFAASVMYLDPFHLLTSQVQYMLLFPTYINVFMVYSFCNLHDISWGTKGATSNSDVKKVDAVVSDEKERELQYQFGEDLRSIQFAKACIALKHGTEPPTKKRSIAEKQEDYERLFRTTVVIWWVFSNLCLMFLFTNNDFLINIFPATLNPYLTFLFWTIALMSVVRFIGSTMYIIRYRKAKSTIKS